jgi:tRNA dimethylallyltransferase
VSGPAVLALVGPTGAGKSAIAVQVARARGAEIVAVDAFTVYRGMDVGTAKPAAVDRAAVPHHMVDVLDPSEDCTVEWFQAAARDRIERVRAAGHPVLLVGGSGLYFRAVVDALSFPPTDAGVRAALQSRWSGDPAGAHAHLAAVDPEAAARIEPGNLRRTVRALEVHELTGRPFSTWRRAWDDYTSVYPSLEVVGLDVPAAELRSRIDERVEAMLAGGLVEECRALAGRAMSTTARQAIGYAEILDHLTGGCTLAESAERIRVRTRRYAARQRRWFRADPRVQWMSASEAVRHLSAPPERIRP